MEIEENLRRFNDSVYKNKLLKVFRFHDFREGQLDIIKNDVAMNDILVVRPSGYGKSITFILPQLLLDNITIVIRPLDSLIDGQCYLLSELNIRYMKLSGSDYLNHNTVMFLLNPNHAMFADVKFVFLTPPELYSRKKIIPFIEKLVSSNRLRRIVFEEAHYIARYDRICGRRTFREAYAMISKLVRNSNVHVPVSFYTATITDAHVDYIFTLYKVRNHFRVVRSCVRDNIKIEVVNTCTIENELTEEYFEMKQFYNKDDCFSTYVNIESLLKGRFLDKVGIVYCPNVLHCELLRSFLTQRGITAVAYSFETENSVKLKIHDSWMMESFKIVIVTFGFGIGIDKSNVRFIIHTQLPISITNYAHQIGKAGKDGEPSVAIMFYNYRHFKDQRYPGNYDEARYHYTIEKIDAVSLQQRRLELYDMLKFAENNYFCRWFHLKMYFLPDNTNRYHINCLQNLKLHSKLL